MNANLSKISTSIRGGSIFGQIRTFSNSFRGRNPRKTKTSPFHDFLHRGREKRVTGYNYWQGKTSKLYLADLCRVEGDAWRADTKRRYTKRAWECGDSNICNPLFLIRAWHGQEMLFCSSRYFFCVRWFAFQLCMRWFAHQFCVLFSSACGDLHFSRYCRVRLQWTLTFQKILLRAITMNSYISCCQVWTMPTTDKTRPLMKEIWLQRCAVSLEVSKAYYTWNITQSWRFVFLCRKRVLGIAYLL